MSSPISSPGVSPVGSSWELYPTDAEETQDNPSTSRAICQATNQQASTIARCSSSENLVEQNLAVESFLDWNPSPESMAKNFPGVVVIADEITSLMEAGGINHNFTPTEAQEFADTMRAIRRPTGNQITRHMKEGTSTIEFRPQHSLLDIHGLGIFLQQKGGFAGCTGDVRQTCTLNEKELRHSSIHLTNYQDLAYKNYQLIWENRAPENCEKYELPKSRYSASTSWPQRKKTSDQLEKQLSYQKRLLHRAVEKMHIDGRPFDPAFRRIFMLTDKECRISENKIPLPNLAKVTGIFFEYKMQIVPLEQETACIAEIYAMPTYTIDEIEKAITDDLRDHPIEIVDLHQISHLLEELGGYAASSALVEREYTIDGQECHCTAIILRNRQDLVNERYAYLWEKYGSQYDLSDQVPPCNYPVPFLQKEKTSEEVQEQLSSQAKLLEKAVEEMYIDGKPFDPLFERIYVPTDQDRINNGASISNLAQTDTILFVYRTSEDCSPKYAVEQVCEMIKTTAEIEGIKNPIPETSIIRRTAQVCLPLLTGVINCATDVFMLPGE